jgi:hypothetical protein
MQAGIAMPNNTSGTVVGGNCERPSLLFSFEQWQILELQFR